MATRSIVTSQPDVECDVCERRLLRGEQPDAFLAAGRRRIVCELCAPRAVQEGWLRETGVEPAEAPTMRPRRGRSLLERLPVPFRARQAARPLYGAGDGSASDEPESDGPASGPPAARAEQPYDFLDALAPGADDRPPAGADTAAGALAQPVPAQPVPAEAVPAEAVPAQAAFAQAHGEDAGALDAGDELPAELERALAAFNAGEHPRRVAGVARSLGAPVVSVRHSEHARSVVTVVVAWELCWYRYEIDLDDSPPEARSVAQGSHPEELLLEERSANALAQESGTLLLAAAQAAAR